MNNRPLFIADGHHRYETAINYRNEMLAKTPNATGKEAFNYIMMYFSNMDDEGMTIWPTHRVVHSLNGFDSKAFLERCSEYFKIESILFDAGSEEAARKAFQTKVADAGASSIAFGVYMKENSAYHIFKLKTPDTMNNVFGSSIPDVFKGLDVTVLHSLILSKILGITQEAQEKQLNLVYVKNSDEALSTGRLDKNQIVFILNPTRIEQVKAVALAGHVMPQKSTYFYPKLLSGLTINPLTGDAAEAQPA